MNRATSETVLITGASSGIGLELAKCFAADKSNLILVARSTEALEKLAGELRGQFGVQVEVLTADLSLPATARRIFSELQSRGVAVDVLVNNAGFGLHGEFLRLPVPRQLEIIHVNITALTELTALFLPAMIARRRGGILNVGSVAGFLPGPNMAVYYASKAFVLSFTEALAEETTGSGVTFSVLCPGPTESNFGKVARGGKARRAPRAKMSAQTVAQIGHQKFRAGKLIVIPGLTNRLLAFSPRLAPRALGRKVVKKYNSTKEDSD
jgi:short-subunit dehydrogenase